MCICLQDFRVLEKDAVGIEIFYFLGVLKLRHINAAQVHVTLGRVNVLLKSWSSRIFCRSGSLDQVPSRIGIEHIYLKFACCTQGYLCALE